MPNGEHNYFLKPKAAKKPRKPLKRGGRLNLISKRRRKERADYTELNREYLLRNPMCEIFCAVHRINPKVLFDARGGDVHPVWSWKTTVDGKIVSIPVANQVHHRSKGRGARLNDTRWFMAASQQWHDWAENHKDEARKIGVLLPIQADAEGRWGSGNQALTTPELLRVRAQRKEEEPWTR